MRNGKYGETNQTMIPRNAAWQCAACKKHIPHTLTCGAYPEGIPVEIKSGQAICEDREKKHRPMAETSIKDMIPRNAAWQCAACKKHIPHTLTCKAYSEQIPEEIMDGEKICEDREKK